MISRAPRLAPSTIRRPRLEEWLGRFKGVPVRFLIAPPGFGKTTALVSYLRHSTSKGLYCSLAANVTAAGVWAAVGRAMQARGGCSSHDELVRVLGKAAPLELALDCEGVPDGGGVGAIARLIDEVPEGVSLLIACRSRAAFDAGRLVTRGMASLCDAERLAFDAAEIAHLAHACGVPFAHGDVPRLLELTDGWPQVVSGALRKAAEDGCRLSGAFENWRKRHGHLFNEFIASQLEGAPDIHAALVRKLMRGQRYDDRQPLQMLEAEGLFVIHDANDYRPLRALTRVDVQYLSRPRAQAHHPLEVRLFGWFHAAIDGREVKWIRRRDQQIFKYLALKAGGSASRAELSDVFWPGGEKQLVSQSLRTACSNIRKAIAHIVGFDAVNAYFDVAGDVTLNFANVVVDVHGFTAFANDGDEEYERGEPRIAYAHYRRAKAICRDNLLIGDVQEPWVAALSAPLQARRRSIEERLTESKPGIAVRASFASGARLAAV